MKLMIVHSALNYTGGKWKIMEYLLKLFPKNINNFVDLFCGGLNVSLNIKANHIYANDIYTPVIDIYKMI
jgi:site-specific DNA-adenine methylase